MQELGQWMRKEGLTNAMLADLCRVDATTVRHWLAGTRLPTMSRRRKINQLSHGTVYFKKEVSAGQGFLPFPLPPAAP